ncbi:hypothetical protein [Flaviflexus massiliensis]|uniref:hypothetical protein n=1 Tax=Flaviflexus massiliensis TaxID=1522309 RepID=UPI0006D55DB1|nr:hypothetical protein [Flaviflexus massiliensis]
MVRHTELSAARRGARRKLGARQQVQRSNMITAGFVGLDGEDTDRALISIDEVDDPVSVIAPPVKIIPGSLVSVAVDHAGRPSRVLGPATVRPEGLDTEAPLPPAQIPMEELAWDEFSPEDQAKLDQAVIDLDQAKTDISEAEQALEDLDLVVLPRLRDDLNESIGRIDEARQDLDTAFPTGPFDVGAEIDGVQTTADAAMVTANGKSTVTYTYTYTSPGPTPTEEFGAGRKPFDIHRNQLQADGAIVAEWVWDGAKWWPTTFGNEVLSSLDVGKLTAGTASLQTAVIQKLVAQLARLIEVDADKITTGTLDAARINTLEVWAEIATLGKIITKELIAAGAVTAESLNVVFTDPATGFGVSIQPEGFTLLDVDGAPMVTLRTDMANAFTVVKDGKMVASISPDGEVAGNVIAARESLLYRGRELESYLTKLPRGMIAHVRNTSDATVGTSSARLLAVTFVTPAELRRKVKVTFRGHPGTSSPRLFFELRQSAGTTVKTTNSKMHDWYLPAMPPGSSQSFEFSHVRTIGEWGWPLDTEITLGIFVRALDSGNTAFFTSANNQEIWVEDVGGNIRAVAHTPWVPVGGGGSSGGNENATYPTDYERSWDSTGHRTYSRTSLSHVRAGSSLVQGAIAGSNSRGHWFFNDAAIRSALAGATVEGGFLVIRNQHTYAGSGMTAVVHTHSYSSAPSSFGTVTAFTSVHVPRGETVRIPLTSTVLNGLKSGSVRGFSLDHGGGSSTSHYGYFSPTATIELNYTK